MTKIKLFSLKKQDFINNASSSAERGSAIIWILVMIALFAALNYTISQGSRGGAATISKEKAALAATEILEYASAHKRAVQTLQINGCDETEISFENPIVVGLANANAPTDNSCHVYHINGGGLRYQEPKEEWMDGLATSQAAAHYQAWHPSSENWMRGLGIDGSSALCAGGASDGSCHELIAGIPFVKKEICTAINKKLGSGSDTEGTPFVDTGNSFGSYASLPFTGSYVTSLNMNMGNVLPSPYHGIMSACVEGDASPLTGTYSFFQVLIVR